MNLLNIVRAIGKAAIGTKIESGPEKVTFDDSVIPYNKKLSTKRIDIRHKAFANKNRGRK